MRLFLRLCLVAFSAGLGVAVAYRLGTEAMAVVVGVLMGVLATLPVAILVLYTMRRAKAEEDEAAEARDIKPAVPVATPMPQPVQPQIVFMPASQLPSSYAHPQWWGQAATPAPAPREFHIVGDDD